MLLVWFGSEFDSIPIQSLKTAWYRVMHLNA